MKRILLLVTALLVALSVSALELERGDIRLVLHENTSRFSLSLRRGGEWIPLLYSDDPRTSSLDILEDNRVHRLGDSGVFEQKTERVAGGARFVWTSPTLRIEQTFLFTQGVRSQDFDAVEMAVTVTNEGEDPSLVGVRLLLDTYLGERSNTHFVTPGTDRITHEAALEPGPVNRYVASVPAVDSSYGFQVMAQSEGTTEPSTIVLANWKRLSDVSWEYQVNETRNFNRLPYSINDSAMLIVFEPGQLRAGEAYRVVLRMGDLSPEGYVAPGLAVATTGADPLLARLTSVVNQINELIQADEINAEEVARLQTQLESLSDLVRGR